MSKARDWGKTVTWRKDGIYDSWPRIYDLKGMRGEGTGGGNGEWGTVFILSPFGELRR
jgi:hypothetical protein